MVSTAVVLLVLGGALTTFQNALAINDSAAQLADANQNLRAGTNQLIRDLLMAGRMIGTEGISMPTGAASPSRGPGRPARLNFDLIAVGRTTRRCSCQASRPAFSWARRSRLGDRHHHDHHGRRVHAGGDDAADRPPSPTPAEGTISPDGTYVRSGSTSQWLNGDTANDTPKIKVGDLVLYRARTATRSRRSRR